MSAPVASTDPTAGVQNQIQALRHERRRLARLGSASLAATKLVQMAVILWSVHLTAPYLGELRFGAWGAITGLMAFMAMFDLGVGNAMLGRTAQATAAADRQVLVRTVSAGLVLLSLLGLASAAVFVAAAQLLPWDRLLRLGSPAVASEVARAMTVMAVLFAVHTVALGALKALAGQQRSHVANLALLASSLLSALALVLAARAQAGLSVLVGATFGVQSLAGVAMVIALMARGDLRWRVGLAALPTQWRSWLGASGAFLVLQLGAIIGWGSDALLLGVAAGAQQVAAFAVAQRLFQFASQPASLLCAPLWAAYAESLARGDAAYVRQALRRSMALSVGVAAGVSMVLLALSGWIVPAWTRGAIQVPVALLALCALWAVVEAGGVALGAYLNGAGLMREQVGVVVAFCALALPAKFWAASHHGAVGLMAALVCCYLTVILLPYATFMRQRLLAPLRLAPAAPAHPQS